MNILQHLPIEDSIESCDVSIIYVNWNCVDEITESIKSLRQWVTSCSYEVIVVDNESPEGSGLLARDSGIRLIISGKNDGFGSGCNIGARVATGEFLLFLNPDTRLLNDVPGELLRFMRAHPLSGIAGAAVENEEGQISFDGGRSLPSLTNEFLQHSTLCFRFPKQRWASGPYLSDWDHRSTREVGSVIGACMMIRPADFKAVGGFDEGFFLYCEEVDLCCRIRQSGLGVWYVSTARILHKERRSTLQLYGSLSRVVLQNLKSQNYYFQKHNGSCTALLWRWMLVGIYLARFIVRRDESHLEFAKWAVTA